MAQEKKPATKPNKDPQINFSRSEFFQNRFALPQALKDRLNEAGLDYRFLNAKQFRDNGGHQSHWRIYVCDVPASEVGLAGLTPENHVVRGDSILGVREKEITSEHRKFIKQRNARQKGFNEEKVKEMKDLQQRHGVKDHTRVYGDDEN